MAPVVYSWRPVRHRTLKIGLSRSGIEDRALKIGHCGLASYRRSIERVSDL